MNYESSARNFPDSFQKTLPPSESYDYDARGNLERITYTAQHYTQAGYAPSCTTANRKYCNQAAWMRDMNGKTTYFEYHAPSGQVSKITYPANERGIHAQTRYDYAPKHARYYTSAGEKTDGDPVWLKMEESYCINSAADDNGNCALNDEVVTRYEYDHDNLFLTRMSVTDPTGKTLHTCYQYDIYGNQIGKTQPKGASTGCN